MQNLAQRLQRLSPKTRDVLRVTIYGVAAGIAAVAFHHAIEATYHLGLRRLAELPFRDFLLWSFLVVMVTSLVAGFLRAVFLSCRGW